MTATHGLGHSVSPYDRPDALEVGPEGHVDAELLARGVALRDAGALLRQLRQRHRSEATPVQLVSQAPAILTAGAAVQPAVEQARGGGHANDNDLQALLEAQQTQLRILRARDAKQSDAIVELQAQVKRHQFAAAQAKLLAAQLGAAAQLEAACRAEARDAREKREREELTALRTSYQRYADELQERRLQLCVLEAEAATRANDQRVVREGWVKQLRQLKGECQAILGDVGTDEVLGAEDQCSRLLRRHQLEEQRLRLQLADTSRQVTDERRCCAEMRSRAEAEATELSRKEANLQQGEGAALSLTSGCLAELDAGKSELERQQQAVEAALQLRESMRRKSTQEGEEVAALQEELRRGVARAEEAMAASEADTAGWRKQVESSRAEAADLQSSLGRNEQKVQKLEREKKTWVSQEAEIRCCEARLAALEVIAARPHKHAATAREVDMTLRELGYEDASHLLPEVQGDTDLLLRASALDTVARTIGGELAELIGPDVPKEHLCVQGICDVYGLKVTQNTEVVRRPK